MARDRVAMILESMAAKKSLKISHYRIYLCLFSAIQEGKNHTIKSICSATGMNLRTAQRSLKELMKTGLIERTDEGLLLLSFWSGFPAKVQKNESTVQKNESVDTVTGRGFQGKTQNDKTVASGGQKCRSGELSQSAELLKKDKKDKSSTLTKNLNLGSDLPDPRFKELVDGIFESYESIIKEKLNPLFKNSDGAMIKRMLGRLPEEKVSRFLESWENFLWTDDDFDAAHRKQAPVRYWATRVTKFFPEKQFDVVEGSRIMKSREKENG